MGRAYNKADLVFTAGSTDSMKINSNGQVVMLNLPEAADNPAHTPNLWIHPNGTVYKTLYAPTRMEDVEKAIDKNNAIKDKLIEKLSARLDELEKRIK